MPRREVKRDVKNNKDKSAKSETIAYRLKCSKTANGLSHFVMYGDVPKGKAIL